MAAAKAKTMYWKQTHQGVADGMRSYFEKANAHTSY